MKLIDDILDWHAVNLGVKATQRNSGPNDEGCNFKMGIPRSARIEPVTDDRKVLNHGAPCQRLTLFDASRRSLLPNLAPYYAYIITCIDKQRERGFNSLYSHFTFNGKRDPPAPLPSSPRFEILFICYEDTCTSITLSLTRYRELKPK